MLDTQDLDVFAMEPVTCRWVRVQLTVAQDPFSRCSEDEPMRGPVCAPETPATNPASDWFGAATHER